MSIPNPNRHTRVKSGSKVIFGQQNSIYPHSFQTYSGTSRNVRLECPNPGGRRLSCSGSHFWTPPHPTYSPDSAPWTSTCLANWKKNVRGRRFPSDDTAKAEVQKCLREQEVSLYRQGLENVIECYDKSWKRFEATRKSRGRCPKTSVCFSFPIYLHSREKTY
jgi:hypothetical protein